MTDFAQTPAPRATPLHHIANRSKRLPPLRVGVGGLAWQVSPGIRPMRRTVSSTSTPDTAVTFATP